MVPTSEKERRLCGPGIFRVAPEKEFFNTIGQDREGWSYSARTRRRPQFRRTLQPFHAVSAEFRRIVSCEKIQTGVRFLRAPDCAWSASLRIACCRRGPKETSRHSAMLLSASRSRGACEIEMGGRNNEQARGISCGNGRFGAGGFE